MKQASPSPFLVEPKPIPSKSNLLQFNSPIAKSVNPQIQYSPFSLQSVKNQVELPSILPKLTQLGVLNQQKADWLQYISSPNVRPYIDAALEVFSFNNDSEDLADTLNRVYRIYSVMTL